jgi:tripartite-type tricarboxylate transporter receptor subunit TctC
MRAIGITTKDRSALLPDIQPLVEQGVPDFDVKTWYGLFVPAKTPRPIIDRLYAEIAKITADPAFRQRLADLGGEAVAVGPDEFRTHVGRELKLWSDTIRTAKIKVD